MPVLVGPLSRAISLILPVRLGSSALDYSERPRMVDDAMENVIGEGDGLGSEDSPTPHGDYATYVADVHPFSAFLPQPEII